MKLKHNTLIFLAGLLWLAIGAFLLTLGITFLMQTLKNPDLIVMPGKFSVLQLVSKFSMDLTNQVVLIITISLMLGYFKGKMALAKSVDRQIKRIESLPDPAHLKYLYSKGYYFLIALMISLGIVMRFLPITLDTRGAIDVVIGSALINGALLYFRKLAQNAYARKRALKP